MKEAIQHLKEQHPYPKDVFIPIKSKGWADILQILQDSGYDDTQVIGNIARIGYESAIAKLEEHA